MGDRSHSAGGIGGLMGRHDDKTGYKTGYKSAAKLMNTRNEAVRGRLLRFNV